MSGQMELLDFVKDLGGWGAFTLVVAWGVLRLQRSVDRLVDSTEHLHRSFKAMPKALDDKADERTAAAVREIKVALRDAMQQGGQQQ